MTSTIHHPVAIPSRGLIICEMEEDSSEPKTILEIGGVSRPKPTYIIPPPRAHALPTNINNQPYLSHWKPQHDIVSPPYPAFTEFQEQRIVRLSNANWTTGQPEKLSICATSPFTIKGTTNPSFFWFFVAFKHDEFQFSMTCLKKTKKKRRKKSSEIPKKIDFISILILCTDSVPENYSPRALKNPHIVSSLQTSPYQKNETGDSNGKTICMDKWNSI